MKEAIAVKTPAIELKKVTKTFGTVVANKDIDLLIRSGEILALLGENGSGKTTLMNILSGIYRPDSGSVFLEGNEVHFKSPKESIRQGIGMIHQHFKLVDVLTARENILLGEGVVAKANLEEICQTFGLHIDLNQKIYNLSVGEKQTVEIIKVLARGAKILILDEPTAVLTPQETQSLFAVLTKMKQQGHAVVIITHKLNEVMEISDRVTILRKGQSIDTVLTSQTNVQKLTEMMVGYPVDLAIKREEVTPGKGILSVHQLSVKGEDDHYKLNNINFTLHEGEILGIAGIAGSGQKELCEAIAGLQGIEGGSILLDGKQINGLTPKQIISKGVSMSFIPEDRLGMGLVGSMGMVDNLMLKTYKEAKGLFINRKPAKEQAKSLIERLEISTPGIYTPVQKLSGGNVQKVLLGREIDSNPRVLITAYPVRGLDINSSHMIYDLLLKQKSKGVAVLYIGEDLDVLLELCDRILVLCGGEVTAIVDTKFATKELIGLKMTNAVAAEESEEEYA